MRRTMYCTFSNTCPLNVQLIFLPTTIFAFVCSLPIVSPLSPACCRCPLPGTAGCAVVARCAPGNHPATATHLQSGGSARTAQSLTPSTHAGRKCHQRFTGKSFSYFNVIQFFFYSHLCRFFLKFLHIILCFVKYFQRKC